MNTSLPDNIIDFAKLDSEFSKLSQYKPRDRNNFRSRDRHDHDNRTDTRNIKASQIEPDIWVGGSRDRSAKNSVKIALSCSVEELPERISALRERIIDIIDGQVQVPVSTNENKRCTDKLACGLGWSGNHNADHPVAAWIIWDLLSDIYHVVDESDKKETAEDTLVASSTTSNTDSYASRVKRDENTNPSSAVTDAWDVEDANHQGGMRQYQHHHSENLPFTIECRSRKSANNDKLVLLFSQIFINFFAGRVGMPRIGATQAPVDGQARWCPGPFCYRALTARSLKDTRTTCRHFHSDEVSFLTSLAYVLVESQKIARATPPPLVNMIERPRRDNTGGGGGVRKARPVEKKKPEVAKPIFSNKFAGLTDTDNDDTEDTNADKGDNDKVVVKDDE